MTTWHVRLRYTGLPELTDAQREHLADELGQYSHNAHARRLTVWETVDADGPLDAHTRAHTATLAALADAGIDGAELAGAQIETEAEHDHQLRSPDLVTVADTTTAGEILGVSRQRAGQLLSSDSPKRDPRAPRPFTITRNGPLWHLGSIELYAAERDPSRDPWKNRR